MKQYSDTRIIYGRKQRTRNKKRIKSYKNEYINNFSRPNF